MAKQGVAKVIGETAPKVGTKLTYQVGWYEGTPANKKNPANVKWQLYKQNSSGSFEKINLAINGQEGFTFKWSAINKTFKLVGYLYEPEMSTAIEIRPQAGERSIDRIGFLDANGNKLTEPPKYGQTVKVVIETINMFAETLYVSLWERDTISDTGHDPEENTKLWGEKEFIVSYEDGKVVFDLMLNPGWAIQANKGLFEGGQHEFYLLVRGAGATTKYSVQQNVDNKVISPEQTPSANHGPSMPQSNTSDNTPSSLPVSPRPKSRPQAPENVSPPTSEDNQKQEPLKIDNNTGTNPVEEGGDTPTTVNETKVEGLIDAYFAKKEYTKETGESAGTFEYEVKRNDNKTSTDAEKENIAKIIFGKPNVKALADKKEYTTIEAIKEKLTKNVYNKGDKITFSTFKLGPNFKKIQSAPLEDKVYLVTTSYLLEGKEAKIIIKEKDGIIKGSADAALPVLELTEAQMKQTEPLKEEERIEKSEFSGAFADDIIKIPIQLRPKSDEELTKWKEKIAKGKEDGEYTYKFNNKDGTTINDGNKKNLAGIILENAKQGKYQDNKIEDGKTAYAEDIEGKLENKTYNQGETITFPLYKKGSELLWLDVSCDGDLDSYRKEFLKKNGAYFVIGGKCFCNRNIELNEFEDILKKLRESEGISNTTGLFYADNCNLDDKSTKSFVDKLNEKLDYYDIKTCIRKIHFLAQIYHETDRLQTTKEYGGTKRYSPYVGRGLMQLTHDSGYARYKSYSGIDVVTDYEKVAEELELAVDSAGWFWKQGKELSPGSSWTVPKTKFSEFDGSTGKQYSKQEYTYELNSVSRKYGTVDINLLADADYIDTISWLINGGDNGRMERREYLKKIKEIFNYPQDCQNAGKTTAGNSNVNIHFSGQSAHADAVSEYTRGILREVGEATENMDIYITSTARTPNDQARIMYDNANRDLQEQRRTYRAPGQAVIDVFEQNQNQPRDQVIALMEARINELGPASVSKHCADPNVTNVFDISISRLTNPNDFLTEIRKRSEVQTVLNENGAYHVEISQ